MNSPRPALHSQGLPEPAIGIWGAGSWGTALAISWARAGRRVFLRPRTDAIAQHMAAIRRNSTYLSDVDFPPALQIWREADDPHIWSQLGACVIATPAAAIPALIAEWTQIPSCPPDLNCVVASKGFDPHTGSLLPRMIQDTCPAWSVWVLSGPSFAKEVAANLPTALVLAGEDTPQTASLVQWFHHPYLRIYRSHDPVGVAWAGAHKNVLAIASGISDALQLGSNARAALITRGLAEMRRLGVAQGALESTFWGLAGIGDLLLTATDPLSRNFRLGRLLGEGMDVDAAMAAIGQVVEGRWSVLHVHDLSQRTGIPAPLTHAVFQVIEERVSIQTVVAQLLMRENGLEFG